MREGLTDPAGADEQPDDRRLLADHVAGDPDAFATLVRRHRDRLWAVAVRTTGDPEDAADALQDALISAFRSAASYRGEAAVTTWLHRIVVNASLDRIRRRRARPTLSLDARPGDPGGRGDDLSGWSGLRGRGGPGGLSGQGRDDVAATLTRLDVRSALAKLPEAQRVALVLVDLEDLSIAEAAEVLGVPEGTIKSRCSRARTALALLLRDEGTPTPSTAAPAAPTPARGNPAAPGDVEPGGGPAGGPLPRRSGRSSRGEGRSDRTDRTDSVERW